jgi:hypothetical protein
MKRLYILLLLFSLKEILSFTAPLLFLPNYIREGGVSERSLRGGREGGGGGGEGPKNVGIN